MGNKPIKITQRKLASGETLQDALRAHAERVCEAVRRQFQEFEKYLHDTSDKTGLVSEEKRAEIEFEVSEEIKVMRKDGSFKYLRFSPEEYFHYKVNERIREEECRQEKRKLYDALEEIRDIATTLLEEG